MDIDPGTPEERLRKAAAWAFDDNRPLLASACSDGASAIECLLNACASVYETLADAKEPALQALAAECREAIGAALGETVQ